MLHNEEILIENIKKKENKVLIWGACERNNDILDFFKQNDVNVVGYIDQNSDKQNTYNDFPVFSKDIIKDNNYFVYVGLLKTYNEVISHLENNNYTEFTDYWYPCREIKLDGSCSYSDLYGNEYVGNNYKLDIQLKNCNKLYIGNSCRFSDAQIIVSAMSKVIIRDNVEIHGKSKIWCSFESDIYIGENCIFENLVNYIYSINYSRCTIDENFRVHTSFSVYDYFILNVYEHSNLFLAKNITACKNIYITSVQNSDVNIGNDCMLSADIVIRAGNSHNIFNLETGENLTSIGRNIVIGDHVWIGQRATLFNGCDIGCGSIVGINAFVNKKFPANCSIAGNPARIIKENVAWRRESYPYFDSYDDFAEFDFR